ncbi:TAXI family TRAP transporter solute-binding subunit [Ruegeria jejuensis]|uniref:TAXI family TRAP transporter solute-binding subunit n=1 Tax=Ruegeria jejuensis TaxID=3233338 RepID=UPI00355B6855
MAIKKALLPRSAGIVAALLLGATSATAQDKGALPDQIAWTAYDVGSAGYNQSVAIGGALKNELGVDLRVLPGKNDISRQIPLRQGRVQFSATGVGGSYLAQEGVFDFASKDWGPQEVRVLMSSNGGALVSMAAAADAGIESMADLKGKRVAWVVGSPALNENVRALLAFANLTFDDVELVEFGGYRASWEGVINGQVDAVNGLSAAGIAFQLEASPRGITWPKVTHSDTAGWERLHAKAPFFVPKMGTAGAGMSPEDPVEGAGYPIPVLITYAEQDEEMVYSMTKAMVELFPNYEGAAPGINGWALDRQTFDWAVPYHAGAVRYFKEIGAWSDAFEAHNNGLIERQGVLKEAWEAFVAEDVADDEFEAAWMAARNAALTTAGMDPVYQP